MNKWEYKTIAEKTDFGLSGISIEANIIDELMNNLGSEGWELVSTQRIDYAGSTYMILFSFRRQLL